MLHRLILGLLCSAILAGCFGDSSQSSSDASTDATRTGATGTGARGPRGRDPTRNDAAPPFISGSPATAVVAGQHYNFQPRVTDSGSGTLTFSIQNAPGWAAFDAATGVLAGVPTDSDVGTYANIVIGVSDGTHQASLPAFPIAVTETATASASLSWTAPTENTNGTVLTNLVGYVIKYGSSANTMTQSVTIDSPGILSYVISNLSPGTWYASVTAYTADNQSTPSAVASWTVD
jgi:hypothetical protein